ncbi:hypothetical protein CMsap09_03805 [Clavibacter michiganensis]|uniref:Uncharacterized protein n=1 Tax=Clavibacter michiganensis TaxID=28447 RepID=A0A251XR72_9MICO|nr:hypothetical protein CMsap09_03805 [Clavibacter michiganensis]
MQDRTDEHVDAHDPEPTTTSPSEPTAPEARESDPPAPESPEAAPHAPEAVEEFERLAVLRMGGEDLEGALDGLPGEEARDVAEVAIDRVVRSYEDL